MGLQLLTCFRRSNLETQKQHESKVTGLARALYPQPGKAQAAMDLLNQLPASIQTDTLLTKSRVLQALKRYDDAEDLLRKDGYEGSWRPGSRQSLQASCDESHVGSTLADNGQARKIRTLLY